MINSYGSLCTTLMVMFRALLSRRKARGIAVDPHSHMRESRCWPRRKHATDSDRTC